MDKNLLSELLDGAAFPAIMLAVAVSQMNVEPNQKNTLPHSGRPDADRIQQKAEKVHDH
jgi:hypothetical protein